MLKPNFHTIYSFSKVFLTIEIKKTYILMYRPVYLGQWILEISKKVMYEF